MVKRRNKVRYPNGLEATARSAVAGTTTSIALYLTTLEPFWGFVGYLGAVVWGAGEVVRYGVLVTKESRQLNEDVARFIEQRRGSSLN